jgi:hypothetical protein
MKKLILFIAILLFFASCKEGKPKEKAQPKFKDGQMAYLKPEYTKVLVITFHDGCFCSDKKFTYEITYTDASGVRQTTTVREVELSATKE